MPDFQLFRMAVFPAKQRDLFKGERSRPQILRDVVSAHPSAELRRGSIWHLGNIREIDENGVYFRIGRTTRATLEVFQDGNFRDEEFEAAPYTHVVLDVALEICAIARKQKLSPKTSGIAHQFNRLLNWPEVSERAQALFEVSEMKDPQDFILFLQQAEYISKFWATFSRPNAFDADEDFFKPLQAALSETHGDRGKAQIEGAALSPDRLVELARSAAATGNDAGATLFSPETGQKTKKRLKGNIVELSQDELADDNDRTNLLHLVRDTYTRIRGTIAEKSNE